jgi:acetoin utilization deacetylase AcuC-like enzyme
MLSVYSDDNALHDPDHFISRGVKIGVRESPERASQLLAALHDGAHEIRKPRDFGRDALLGVHDPRYIHFLANAYDNWQTLPQPRGPYVLANSYAMRQMKTLPTSFEGQLGFFLSGNSVPIGPQSWRAIASSANCALEAADAVRSGAFESYALCRPPGHHAYADLAGGYCYLNNSALAAQHLRGRFARVAVIDVDVHHGNGTQGIFWERGDVLTVSIHGDPNTGYPWQVGYAAECGEGEGLGKNLNLPLPLGTSDAPYLAALDHALEAVRAFEPEACVIALGLDAFEDDSSEMMRVTTTGFGAIGARIGALRLPSVIVQEGGYAVEALRKNLGSFLGGFLSERRV